MNATPIPRRRLGAADLEVSALGLGCMGMSDFYGAADEAQSLAVLNHALDIGVNFLDTADMYGVGANETLLSKVLKTRRQEVVLATKFGNVRKPDGSFVGVDGSPAYVRSACEASLKRLGVDHIDLYYQHRVDRTVPIEDTVGAMADLVREGKVRHLGLSEAAPATIRRAHAVHPIAALQTEYSLWTRDVEAEILPLCRELKIGFVPYSPLGRGFLTGALRNLDQLAANDWRRQNPRFQGENLKHNLALVDAVTALAEARGCTPAQLALAWLMRTPGPAEPAVPQGALSGPAEPDPLRSRGPQIVPIPGTRSIARLDENAGAARLVLAADELAAIEAVLARQPVAGTRYPEAGMASVNG